MKLTKEQLKQIIKEEIRMVMEMTDSFEEELMNVILQQVAGDFVSVDSISRQLGEMEARGGLEGEYGDEEIAEYLAELVKEGILEEPDDEGDHEEGPNYVPGQEYNIY
tara:strand:- start:556 stop:879 length:324 start_codon:yes stop_codon:yes gene_type:complete